MKTIKLYTSDTCGYCHMAKAYFEEKNLAFEERNVTKDSEARKELMEKGFMGVPVIAIEDVWLLGFDKQLVEKELNK